ncbi:MAG: helix-turn-helix domain-containing protein [Proteobacteria bacterium]|nr:helix-turn-helix domain-containing protein [Pseudomonadota bacterium]
MTNRITLLLDATGLSRPQVAVAIGCDTSTISRLIGGRPETRPQTLLLDHLARQHGLLHLVSDSFRPAAPAGEGAGPAPEAAP